MPAQKRSSQSENADDEHQSAAKLSRRDQDPEQEDDEHEPKPGGGDGGEGEGEGEGEEEGEDSDDSASSSVEEKPDPEFVMVKLAEIRKDVQCPICLGIIKKTRTVMECLHRFCRECIDKSMRLGNNECPACRTHCASRRSLRDDPNFDALIAALYPDIDKYEEEELAFLEEEKNRNKQIQASIAQILQRQSEALVKRRSMGKDVAGGFTTRAQRNLRSIPSRRRRNSRGSEYHGSEDNEDENDSNGGKDSGSADERTEVRPKRRKKRGSRGTLASSSADIEGHGNDLGPSRDSRGISPGLVWNPEMLAWGRGGTRSNTRYGGHNGNNKNSRNTRISKLVEHLRSLEENNELDVHLMLISLEKEKLPNLKQPYLCGRSKLSVKHLSDYVAQQTNLKPEEVEILAINLSHNQTYQQTLSISSIIASHGDVLPDAIHTAGEMQVLEREETLAGVITNSNYAEKYLILGYRQKHNVVS